MASSPSASWSRPAERARAPLALALGLALFIGAWTALHHGVFRRDQVIDTPVYQRYGDAIARGQVPYRDFGLEYPPAALPVFALPALGQNRAEQFPAYRRSFEALMWVCGALGLAALALALRGLGAGRGRTFAALAFAGLAPLALGSVVISRFDLWPAAIATAALAALVSGRGRLGLGLLGLGVATKVYPGVLVPLAIAHIWRTRGRREALVCTGVLAAVLVACFAPFVALAPGGVWDSVVRQTTRPLQVESLGAAFLVALHHLVGYGLRTQSGHGSQNLGGSAANAIGALQTLAQIAALVGLWFAYARGRADPERLIRYAAAAVLAFVALGKVLSPQFLIWLIPLVPLVRGRRGLAASSLLGLALVLTQLYFPFRYWDYALGFAALPSWLVLARDAVLLALLAVLAWPDRRSSQVI